MVHFRPLIAFVIGAIVTLILLSFDGKPKPNYLRFEGRLLSHNNEWHCQNCQYQIPKNLSRNFCPNCGMRIVP